MFDDVIERLKSLGYSYDEQSDEWMLDFAIEKAESAIKNECNKSAVPKELHCVAVDMACGEFLTVKKNSGQLTGFDVAGAVKQVKEGDTSVTYAVADRTSPFDSLIDYLINGGKSQLISFRGLAW